MTSIGTRKISHRYNAGLPLLSPLPVFTRIACVQTSPRFVDGHRKFASLSSYDSSFSNLSRRPVGLVSFGVFACSPLVGFTSFAAEPGTLSPRQAAAAIVGFVVFIVLVGLWMRYDYKKDKEASEHLRKGGEPRNSRERKKKFMQGIFRDFVASSVEAAETPHILTCSHGIIRYRPLMPASLKVLTSTFLSEEERKESYDKVDAEILKLLENDPNLDLSKYASNLHIELVDFHRKNALPAPPPASPRIFALKNIVLSYDVVDPAKSPEEIDKQLRLILEAHPSADLNALAGDLGITIRNIQRKGGDDGFQTYDLPIGTKSQ